MPRRTTPPLLQSLGATGPSGMGILDEYDGVGGFVLWISFRDSELFARSDAPVPFHSCPSERGALIDGLSSPHFGPVKPALQTLCALLAPAPPARDAIAAGCQAIAGWSELGSRLQTAVEYA